MAIVNHAKREINAKIVYFGHEGAGKGTSLRYIYGRIKPSLRGELKVLPTVGSELLFFDFTPFEQPLFNGYRIRFQMYTLNGTVTNPAAWKMMLKGADGLVLVADAGREQLPVVRHSVLQLRGVLNSYGVALDDIPLVLQLNKADRAGRVSSDEVASLLGLGECDVRLTTATSGDGVLETLTSLSRKIMARIGEHGDVPQVEQGRGASSAGNEVDEVRPVSAVVEPEQPVLDATVVPACLPEQAPFDIQQADDARLRVRVAADGICMKADCVRIPLEIAGPGGMQRLVVTVAVEPA
jgi:GTPase SAR1 family protein